MYKFTAIYCTQYALIMQMLRLIDLFKEIALTFIVTLQITLKLNIGLYICACKSKAIVYMYSRVLLY